MMTLDLILAAVFVLLAVIFIKMKESTLLQSFNTIPQKDRSKMNTKALRRYIVGLLFFIAGCLTLPSIIYIFSGIYDSEYCFLPMMIGCIPAGIYANWPGTLMIKEKK